MITSEYVAITVLAALNRTYLYLDAAFIFRRWKISSDSFPKVALWALLLNFTITMKNTNTKHILFEYCYSNVIFFGFAIVIER